MPNLLPMAISLVAWSSTSAGPSVKRLSRCGSGLGAEAEEDVARVVRVHVVVHHYDAFGEHHLPHAPETVHDFGGLHWVGLPDADEDEVVEDESGGQRDVHDLGEFILKMGRTSFMDALPIWKSSIGGMRRWWRDRRRLCGA